MILEMIDDLSIESHCPGDVIHSTLIDRESISFSADAKLGLPPFVAVVTPSVVFNSASCRIISALSPSGGQEQITISGYFRSSGGDPIVLESIRLFKHVAEVIVRSLGTSRMRKDQVLFAADVLDWLSRSVAILINHLNCCDPDSLSVLDAEPIRLTDDISHLIKERKEIDSNCESPSQEEK